MRSRRSLFLVRASLLVVHRATGDRNWSVCHKFTAAVKTPFQRICSNQPIETYTLFLLEQITTTCTRKKQRVSTQRGIIGLHFPGTVPFTTLVINLTARSEASGMANQLPHCAHLFSASPLLAIPFGMLSAMDELEQKGLRSGTTCKHSSFAELAM